MCRYPCTKNQCTPSNKILYRERVVKYWFQLEEADVVFEYWNDQCVTWKSTWLISGASTTWLPRVWRGDFYHNGDDETKLALRYVLNGAPTFIRSNYGCVPNQLRVCKYCRNAVYSDDEDMIKHWSDEHSIAIRKSALCILWNKIKKLF